MTKFQELKHDIQSRMDLFFEGVCGGIQEMEEKVNKIRAGHMSCMQQHQQEDQKGMDSVLGMIETTRMQQHQQEDQKGMDSVLGMIETTRT
jgi:hypothetical protein